MELYSICSIKRNSYTRSLRMARRTTYVTAHGATAVTVRMSHEQARARMLQSSCGKRLSVLYAYVLVITMVCRSYESVAVRRKPSVLT